MPRFIDADKVEKWTWQEPKYSDSINDRTDLRDFLRSLPTISPDDVRGVGEWEDAKQHGLCRCSVCKDCYIEKDYITQTKWKYCPSCGARMKGAEDGTTDY